MKTLDEVRRIKKESEAELLELPGVTGVGIGYKYVGGKKSDVLTIRVYVKEKREVPEEHSIPRQIQGIPTDVIERRFVLQADKTEETDKNNQNLR